MPWTNVNSLPIPTLPSFPYVFVFFAQPPGGLSLGVSAEVSGTQLRSRYRVGFAYPAVFFSGKTYLGPGLELVGSQAGNETPVHALTYAFFTAAAASAATDEFQGVLVGMDRGIIGATAKLWRFT